MASQISSTRRIGSAECVVRISPGLALRLHVTDTMWIKLFLVAALCAGAQSRPHELVSKQASGLLSKSAARQDHATGEEVRELGEGGTMATPPPTGKEVKRIDAALDAESKAGLGNSKAHAKKAALDNMKAILAIYKKGPLNSVAARELRGLCVAYTKLIRQKTHKPIKQGQHLISIDKACSDLMQKTETHHAAIQKAKKAEKKMDDEDTKTVQKSLRKAMKKPDAVANEKAKKMKLEKQVTLDSKTLLRKLKEQSTLDAKVAAAKTAGAEKSKVAMLQTRAQQARSAVLRATVAQKESEAALASLNAKTAKTKASQARKAARASKKGNSLANAKLACAALAP